MAYLLMFVLGGVAGAAYDYIHVYYGVLTYAAPDFAGTQLKFVIPLFGASSVLAAFIVKFLGTRLKLPRVTAKRLALDAFLLLAGYLATGWLVEHDLATLGCLAVIAAVSIATRPSGFVVIAAVLAAIVGPLSETVISSTGVFHYNFAHPIPIWLPLLWIIASGMFLDLPVLLVVGPHEVAAKRLARPR